MKVYNTSSEKQLDAELADHLQKLREERAFNAKITLDKKLKLVNKYFKVHNLNAAVIGVSGGIDSAVVLGILKRLLDDSEAPLEKIVPLALPVFNPGATNQDKACNRAQELCNSLDLDITTIDLTASHKLFTETIGSSLNVAGEGWALGQVVSYLRTPALYYTTSLLVQNNYKPVVVGTTNKDEGAYLGYFGKASDGMVDIQIIGDLHKSEVYSLAKELNIVESIIKIPPAGDMFDGRNDEEVFGAPYDFVELYLLLLEKTTDGLVILPKEWSRKAATQFKAYAQNLENLHEYNKHKYIGHSPAVHLNIYNEKTPNGWIFGEWS